MTNSEEKPNPPAFPPSSNTFTSYPFFGEIILLFTFIFYEIIKKLISNKLEDITHSVYQVFDGDEKLKDISEKILPLFRADRVLISTFVNGEKTPDGLHFYKLKIRTESLRGNTVSVCNIIGSDIIPIKRLKPEYDKLLKEKEIEISRKNFRSLPLPCKRHLRRINVQGLYQVMVFSDYNPIGLITVHFSKSPNLETLEKVKHSNEFLYYLSEVRKVLKQPNNRFRFRF